MGEFSTDDMGVAAYIHSRGQLTLARVDRDGAKVFFVFEDPHDKGGQLQIAFANSPERRYDESVRTMKKLAFGNRR